VRKPAQAAVAARWFVTQTRAPGRWRRRSREAARERSMSARQAVWWQRSSLRRCGSSNRRVNRAVARRERYCVSSRRMSHAVAYCREKNQKNVGEPNARTRRAGVRNVARTRQRSQTCSHRRYATPVVDLPSPNCYPCPRVMSRQRNQRSRNVASRCSGNVQSAWQNYTARGAARRQGGRRWWCDGYA